ncbi:MAG: alpha/beta hydrolase domain-containing protein, partial [Candidatus Poribacteria bacterium]|nr:alpha/beta hydrolase domain-containing protein [Candidatus Poribacteria bacterium]
DGTAVPPAVLKKVFNQIPGANYPEHHALPRRRDYGLMANREQVTKLPPTEGKPYGSLVSAVDADGNEVTGVTLPEIAVPLAAHTGWTLRHSDIGGESQLLMFAGGTLPFAATASERRASGDPRRSIAERYASKENYQAQVRAAAEKLVQAGYMLEEDITISLAQASKFWDYFANGD